jgi:hypothetical protein
MPTRRTQFRRREESIQWQIVSSVPHGLVFQFADYLPERRIRDMFGKIVILYHPGHVQAFDIDRLVLADDLRREFLKRVSSGIADSGVQPGHSESGSLSIITVLVFTRQTALQDPQSLFAPNKWARVFDLLAVASRDLNFGYRARFSKKLVKAVSRLSRDC